MREPSFNRSVGDHLGLLGLKAVDKVTGLTGVITSVSFDLYGCVQAVLTPQVKAEGDLPDSRWCDIPRLRITSEEPVMERPNFLLPGPIASGVQGAAEKPALRA